MVKTHFLAIGANLPGTLGTSPLAACEAAAALLSQCPGVGSACRSRWYSSAPIPSSNQPRYINGVVRIETDLAPAALLLVCQAIESRAGRTRSIPDAARTLDLDIIDMGGIVRGAPDPVLPHPRAHLRAFVLLPLRDVAPGWIHPVLNVPIGALIACMNKQDIFPV